jgi:hypothetical protein
MLVSPATFMTAVNVTTISACTWWIAVDSLRLRRSLREQPRTGWVRDRIFGSIIGISTGLIGLVGQAIYHFG